VGLFDIVGIVGIQLHQAVEQLLDLDASRNVYPEPQLEGAVDVPSRREAQVIALCWRLGCATDPTGIAHDGLQLGCRGGVSPPHEHRFGRRIGHSRNRAGLGVGERPGAEPFPRRRTLAQAQRDTDLLAGRGWSDPKRP
jgi:hypothetical protein